MESRKKYWVVPSLNAARHVILWWFIPTGAKTRFIISDLTLSVCKIHTLLFFVTVSVSIRKYEMYQQKLMQFSFDGSFKIIKICFNPRSSGFGENN